MLMNTAIRSDVGCIRAINEDRAAVHHSDGGALLALLADGMGGHQAGDIASQTAIDVITTELGSLSTDAADSAWREAVLRAIEIANKAIYSRSQSSPQLSGMGTTVIAAALDERRLVIGSVGDSRAYLLRSGALNQLTEDHSLVGELLRSGQITPAEALDHPRRNVLTRALGTESHVDADIQLRDWQAGDILLICSDGLTNMMKEQEIVHILQEEGHLEGKADRLIERALEAGGDDNVTVVLVEHGQMGTDGRESE
jgi:PPM family protein phosphatase